MEENIFNIQNHLLVRCTVNKPEVVIPEGVSVVAGQAFRAPDSYKGPLQLERLVVAESVTLIEAGAFQYCEQLRSVTILGNAEIGSEAFLGCNALEEVYLAEGVTAIGSKCFAYCDNIDHIYIPQSVVRIGHDIARMNDAGCSKPLFRCYAKGPGARWDDDWNRVYNDPRFVSDRSHHYYHPTVFGVGRDGESREQDQQGRIPCNDMPHGTGEKPQESINEAVSWRLPPTRLRLWLTATLVDNHQNNEYLLDEEEREMLPHSLREDHQAIERKLDEPWQITVDDETRHLAPELAISAWINDFDDHYDGQTLIVHHDMTWHNNPYDDYPVSRLTPGGTVIAERLLFNGQSLYDVRLHIHWPKQQLTRHTLDEVMYLIANDETLRRYQDGSNEIEVLLAHSHWKAEPYKSYKPGEIATRLAADLKAEGETWRDLGQVVLQAYEYYEEVHSFSDDYKDAATAYGKDCDDWTTTERRKTGPRICFEIA